MFDPARPFVLLDDVPAGRARLFSGLLETVTAEHDDSVAAALARLAEPGPWAGFVGFEAGYALEPRLATLGRAAPAGEPLLWMGRFAHETPLAEPDLLLLLGDGPDRIGTTIPDVDAAGHADAVARIKALIASGDIYQANLTFQATIAIGGRPLAIYRRLRAGSRAPYGALVFTGRHWLLSFSPELFFRLEGRQLTARPMKGTATRGADPADDDARAAALGADPKNRAENLMITDLIRNDFSRVGDDVRVPALFRIERYPTVLQMTSTITAMARPGVTAADVLTAMFPCGSVTGAPKIRAMEVIAAVEPAPRGVYTGSIGAIAANGDALFNVAIRTLVLPAGADTARLGLGSGIVADSDTADEWHECLAKAAFLTRRGPPDLIETMRMVDGALPDLDRHLDRMAASAGFLGLAFDRARIAAAARAAARGAGRLRLLLAPSGRLAIQTGPLPHPQAVAGIAVVPLPVGADDWRLRHKCTDRAFYDEARRAAGCDEVIFERPDGQLTEGSFTSLFVPRDGLLLTPPLAAGLLPGVLRARLLAEGKAREAPLTRVDLAQGFFIGNALRGLIPARLRR